MTTARDMVQGAFEAAQVYAPGEQQLDADIARGFLLLNQMIDSWSNESLTTFAILEQHFPLVAAKTAYTIGPSGADVIGPRPIRITEGIGAAYLMDSNNNRYPVRVVPKTTWNQIWNIVSVSSNLPDTLYYDPEFPLGILNVYPLYNGALSAVMYFDSFAQLSVFPNLTSNLALPPGYERAIESNLAVLLDPYFPTAKLTTSLIREAATSKANIMRSNTRENIAVFERILGARGNASWNIYSDSWR